MSGLETQELADGTSMTTSQPWGTYVSAKLLCSDGIVRKTANIDATADTFFSVPCDVIVEGKNVRGYMSTQSREGFDTITDDDPMVATFRQYTYGKHHSLLPSWKKDA